MLRTEKHAERFFDRARAAMRHEILGKDGQPSRWRLWLRNWKTRRALLKMEQHWRLQSPHQRLFTYITLMRDHPELRRAMRDVLNMDTGKRRDDAPRIVLPH